MEVNPMLIKDESDLEGAVMAACKEYCLTEEGKSEYEGNCNNFTGAILILTCQMISAKSMASERYSQMLQV